ncbi:NADP-dependent oxidoreductase [Actinomycetospora chiangmaiensis]|uniref:NADP-dependent oxidoreductase n=1 Tax=Actinomycetospora chiangmaiensis TaxID=402650 RepID=UPI000371EDEE|nr:NADP-dependent oxidoreductase [Actinomycetospora chiangmaiensis]
MRAARFHRYGGPEVLTVEDAPEPHAGSGSIRIRVGAASVNPIDWLLRAGALAEFLPLDLPAIPGRDAAGVVDEVGPDVEGVAPGDLVFGLGGHADTTAEFAVLTAWAPVPSTWSVEEAAAAGLGAVTSLRALAPFGDLRGRTLLVDGASGAVGTAATAAAVHAGATVIGTAREANHESMRAAGVLPTPYGPGLPDRVRALAPQGVDVALHAAASDALPDLVEIVGDPTRVVTVIDRDGAARLGTHLVDAANDSAVLAVAAELGRAGHYRPRVAHVLPLDDIVKAHELAAAGNGKVVVTLP